MEERCPTTLLADTPAETDAFGGHERVARSIVEVVQTEDGGRSIGLEGGWGAGKSTIVRLTSKELAQSKGSDDKIAVFDIWAHQDDPLRRTFLENLITRIQGFGWVSEEKWNRRLAELNEAPPRGHNQCSTQIDRCRCWVCTYATGYSRWVSLDCCWRYAPGIRQCLGEVGVLSSTSWLNRSTCTSDLLRRRGNDSTLEKRI